MPHTLEVSQPADLRRTSRRRPTKQHRALSQTSVPYQPAFQQTLGGQASGSFAVLHSSGNSSAFTTSRNFFSKNSLAEWCPYTRRLRLAQTSGPALGQVVSQGQVPSVPFWAAALKRSEYHSRVVSYTTLDIFEIDTSIRICYDVCC